MMQKEKLCVDGLATESHRHALTVLSRLRVCRMLTIIHRVVDCRVDSRSRSFVIFTLENDHYYVGVVDYVFEQILFIRSWPHRHG